MNELTPQSLEQWREEREAEKRTTNVAAFAARYLDDDGDSPILGTRDERIREGVKLGIITREEAAEMLSKATDAAIDAMAEGASGADAYHDVSDAEFARLMPMVMMPWSSQLATQSLVYYDKPQGGL